MSSSLRTLHSLSGSTVLVTGAAGHVGLAIAETLHELGATLLLSDRVSSVQDVAARLPGATACVADLGDEAAVRALPGRAFDATGRLDVVVHCGAMVSAESHDGWTSPFEQQSSETWRRSLDVNLTAPFILSQAAYPLLKPHRGRIVMIGSIYGMLGPQMALYEGLPMGNSAAYAAGKGGLLQLTRWLATVLAPEVRVNMITLGGIERGQPEPFQQRYRARTPLGRMGREEDIKGAVAFLATHASAYVTGQNVTVDGGFSTW